MAAGIIQAPMARPNNRPFLGAIIFHLYRISLRRRKSRPICL